MSTNWIPFDKGEYWVEQAFIVAPGGAAVALEQPYIEVDETPRGVRYLVGKGLVTNMLIVELLEESDELDILLDLGAEFKYRLKQPRISAGKVFSADTKSTLQFSPVEPWKRLDADTFASQMRALERIDRPGA